MLTLPESIIAILAPFAPLFSRSVFRHVQVLIAGAILTPGRHTVANALRMMGLGHTRRFGNYHRVLNRAKWSSRRAAKVLLNLLVAAFVPNGEILVGIDETLERRRGAMIEARGVYRDAVRSSKKQVVKSSGLRWICMSLLAPIPWISRFGAARCVWLATSRRSRQWSLPFLSVLAPSERYDQERDRNHKTIATWALQMVIQLRHWLPKRKIVVVGDSTYASITLLNRCVRFKNPVTMVSHFAAKWAVVTRLRLDAALFEPAPARKPGQRGRPRKIGDRLPSPHDIAESDKTVWTKVVVPVWYNQRDHEVEIVSATSIWYHPGEKPVPIRYVLIREPQQMIQSILNPSEVPSEKPAVQALLCTDISAEPLQIVEWFVQRWQLEETFQEVRTHLGVETQRQWSKLAILRTTPALLGLFSFVTLVADRLAARGKLSVRSAAWYGKEEATFSDAIACVRREIWQSRLFLMSAAHPDIRKTNHDLFAAMEEALCYAA